MRPISPDNSEELKDCAPSDFGHSMVEGFTKASMTAIGMHDASTKAHSERVAILTVALANAISQKNKGPYATTMFSALQIEELRYASLLHDFGKIGVRGKVLHKEKKFYPYQLDKIFTRFSQIKDKIYIKFLEGYLEKLMSQNAAPQKEEFEKYAREAKSISKDIDLTWQIIEELNEPSVSSKEVLGEISKIADMKIHIGNTEMPLLTSAEIEILKIPRGSLTETERLEIQDHVKHSYNFLVQLPWTQDLKDIPDIVLSHHERLNGSGYPRKLTSEDIPLQAKILSIADIYDALVAYDRPYKKAVSSEHAFHILEAEVKSGKLDAELVTVFHEEKIYELIDEFVRPGNGSRGQAAG